MRLLEFLQKGGYDREEDVQIWLDHPTAEDLGMLLFMGEWKLAIAFVLMSAELSGYEITYTEETSDGFNITIMYREN